MADFDPALAISLLEANRTGFGTDDATRDAYLKEARARLGARSSDDRKEAAKLAVETAKSFLTIALAVLAATVALIQFAKTNGVQWASLPMACFGVTGALLVLSMIAGFSAISTAYKRADGRKDPTLPAWSTDALAPQLNWQGRLGGISILTLIAGILVWANAGDHPAATVAISIPSSPGSAPAQGPVIIGGVWTELKIKTAGGQELTLPQGSGPVQFSCK